MPLKSWHDDDDNDDDGGIASERRYHNHSGNVRNVGKGGNVTSAGWQVTLCDPMWHVSSRSGVATLRTAIGLHALVTYLLTYLLTQQPSLLYTML